MPQSDHRFRTVIRVISVNPYRDEVKLKIIAWEPNNGEVTLPKHKLPTELSKLLEPDYRFYAKVNLNAEKWQDLVFTDYEWTGTLAEQKQQIKDYREKHGYEILI